MPFVFLQKNEMKFFVILFLNFLFNNDLQKGIQLFEQSKYEEAKKVFEKIITENPKDYQAMEYLGDIAFYQKDWESCMMHFGKLKDVFPKNADFHFKYGGAMGFHAKEISKFKALRLIDTIEASFLKAASLDPNHIHVRWALVMFYCELPGILGGSEKKSLKYASELMQLSKVDGYLAYGHIEEYFKRYEKAEQYFLKAHQIGNSKVTFQRLFDLYSNKMKDAAKAQKLKSTSSPKNS